MGGRVDRGDGWDQGGWEDGGGMPDFGAGSWEEGKIYICEGTPLWMGLTGYDQSYHVFSGVVCLRYE